MEKGLRDISKLLHLHYGILHAEITPMEGYESSNFKIESTHNKYVLKVYNSNQYNKALLKGENKILKKLTSCPGYEFSSPIKSLKGKKLVEAHGKIYRLLSYVDGIFLGEVFRTGSLANDLGLLLGKMDKITVPFYNAAIMAKQTQWDLQHFNKNRKLVKHIPNPQDRSLVEYFLLQFNEHVVPIQEKLRKGIVHNDANEWNILTKNGTISGIIDFGDMAYTWVINEIAVAITYYMMDKEDPLEDAAQLIEGYNSILKLELQELDILYYLVAARLCTSVCNSAYSKKQNPDSKYIVISEKSAWKLLYKWLTISSIKAKNTFRKAAGYKANLNKKTSQLLEIRHKTISRALSLSYHRPICMEQSAFQYMYDNKGNTLLDAYNNIMLVGHCHPKIVSAGQRTMAKLNTNTRYLYDELTSYSQKLLSKFPSSLNKVFFVNSGSAASDLAIRLAKTHTKKNKIMVMEHGYHGNTDLGIDISHYKYHHIGETGKKDFVVQTPMPKIFNSGYSSESQASNHYLSQACLAIENNKDEIGTFIAEPIIGCGGQVPLPDDYLKNVYTSIRKQGGICISDEVQVGFGRLGKYFWGYEMYDVVPDIVILGKPMGNGHPIGAVVTTDVIASSFENGLEFFSSFGGNPVSCAIGEAVLDVIEEEQLDKHAEKTGNYLKMLLKNLSDTHLEIADVRGEGLFLGVEILTEERKPDSLLASYLKNGLRNKNILISTDGPDDNVLKIKPPLYFNKDNCETLVTNLEILLRKK